MSARAPLERMLRALAVALVTCLLVAVAWAQEDVVTERRDGLQVEAVLTPRRPALGEPATLTLTATLAPGLDEARIEWPELGRTLLAALGEDVVEVERVALSPDRLQQSATLRFYDSGEHGLPSLTVDAVRATPGADTETLASVDIDPGVVHVPSSAPPEAERLPSRGALGWREDPEGNSWAWWALAVALVLLAVAAVLWRWTLRPTEAPEEPPPLPPDRRALDALDALLAEELPRKGLVAPFFTRLSAIARRYVEERFGLRAPEQTTEEFLVELSRRSDLPSLTPEHRALLREFLTRADLVKFARADAAPTDCGAAAGDVRAFVMNTRPPAVAPLRPEPGEIPREAEA